MEETTTPKLKLSGDGTTLWIDGVRFVKFKKETTWTDTNVVEEVWQCPENEDCPVVAKTTRTITFCQHRILKVNQGLSGYTCGCKLEIDPDDPFRTKNNKKYRQMDPLKNPEEKCKSSIKLMSHAGREKHNHWLNKMEYFVEMITKDIESGMKEDPSQNPLDVYARLRTEYLSNLEPEKQKDLIEAINRSCLGILFEKKINKPVKAKKMQPKEPQVNIPYTRHRRKNVNPLAAVVKKDTNNISEENEQLSSPIFELVRRALEKSNKLSKDGSTFAQIVMTLKQDFSQNNDLGMDFRTWHGLRSEDSKFRKDGFILSIQQALQDSQDRGEVVMKLKGTKRVTEKYTLVHRENPSDQFRGKFFKFKDNASSAKILEDIAEVNIKEEVVEEVIQIKEEMIEVKQEMIEVKQEMIEVKQEMIEEDQLAINNEDMAEKDPLDFTSKRVIVSKKRKNTALTACNDIVIPHKFFKGIKDNASSNTLDKLISDQRRIYDAPGMPLPPEAFQCPVCSKTLKLEQPPFGKYLYHHFKQHASQIGTVFDLMEEKQTFWCKLCVLEVGPKIFSRHFNFHLDRRKTSFQNIYLEKSGLSIIPSIKWISCIFCSQQLIDQHERSKETISTLFQHLKNDHKENFSCMFWINDSSQTFFCKYCQVDVSPEEFQPHVIMHTVGTEQNHPDVELLEVNVKADGINNKKEVVIKPIKNGPLKTSDEASTKTFSLCAICYKRFQIEEGAENFESIKNFKIFIHYKRCKDHISALLKVIHMDELNSSFFCLVCTLAVTPLDLYDHIKEHLDVKKDLIFKKNGSQEQLEVCEVKTNTAQANPEDDVLKVNKGYTHKIREENIARISASNLEDGTTHQCLLCKELISTLADQNNKSSPSIFQHYKKHKEQLAVLVDLKDDQEKIWCRLCKYYIYAKLFHQHLKSHVDPNQEFFEDVYIDETSTICLFKKFEKDNIMIGRSTTTNTNGKHKMQKHRCIFCNSLTFVPRNGCQNILFDHLQTHAKEFSEVALIVKDSANFLCKMCGYTMPSATFLDHLRRHITGYHGKFEKIKKVSCGNGLLKLERIKEDQNLTQENELIVEEIGDDTNDTDNNIVENVSDGSEKVYEENANYRRTHECPICKEVIFIDNENIKNNAFPFIYQHYAIHKDELAVLMKINDLKTKFFCKACKEDVNAIEFYEHLQSHIDPQQPLYKNIYIKDQKVFMTENVAVVVKPQNYICNTNIKIQSKHPKSEMTSIGDMLDATLSKTKCKLCHVSFETPSQLEEHLSSVHFKDGIKCAFCPERFPTVASLGGHLQQVHNFSSSGFPKPINKVSTSSSSTATKSSRKIIIVRKEDKNTQIQPDFSAPQKNIVNPVTKENDMSILDAEEQPVSKVDWKVNWRSDSNSTRCFFCPQIFMSKNVTKHMTDPNGHAVKNIGNRSKHWTCETCHRTFVSMSALLTHVQSEREKNDTDHHLHRFVCNLCRTCYGSIWWTHQEHIKEYHLGPNSMIKGMWDVGSTSGKFRNCNVTGAQIKEKPSTSDEGTIGVFVSSSDSLDDIAEPSIKIEKDDTCDDIQSEIENCLNSELHLEEVSIKTEEN